MKVLLEFRERRIETKDAFGAEKWQICKHPQRRRLKAEALPAKE